VQLSRRQLLIAVALGAVVVALGVRYLVLAQAPDAGATQRLVLTPLPAADAGGEPSPSPSASVVVYVCGAVRAPGVVCLPAGARVADALELAGGATARADLTALNLAARLSDGQQVLVPARVAGGAAAAAAAAPAAAAGAAPAAGGALVNINTATLEELDSLQGIGPVTAQKIIDYRTANGPFGSIEEIKNVPGIGEAKFAAIKDAITV